MSLSPRTALLSLGLTAILLAPAAAARSSAGHSSAPQPFQGDSPGGPAVPAPLLDPSALIRPDPDVTLAPVAAARTLTLVVARTETAMQVGHRYGVARTGVTLLPAAPGERARLAQVTLASSAVGRAPRRPTSVESYRVRPGDTLAGVASRFDLRIVELLGMNLDRPSLDRVHIGEVLNIPTEERGLLLRIKPGQSALSLIVGYGADLTRTARANGVLPTELQVGDALLLPGVRAEGFQQRLLAQRDAEKRAAVAYAQQLKYERFQAWKQSERRQRAQEAVARQEQYERFLAWHSAAERQAKIRAYERQVAVEAAQAAARAAVDRLAASARFQGRGAVVQRASTGAPGLAWPMRSYRITSRFGERDIAFHREVFHGGVDFAAAYGSPIYAALDGEVTRSGYGDYGLNVLTVNGNSTVVYGHMSRTAVVAGQRVSQGQLVGYVGCSGICTGPHLHFEVRLGGQPVDPLALLP